MKNSMRTYGMLFAFLVIGASFIHAHPDEPRTWIRVNQLGYMPTGIKVAVWVSKEPDSLDSFVLVNAGTGRIEFRAGAGPGFGSYGPFNLAYRLNFSDFTTPGRYYLQAGDIVSPVFRISDTVYAGAADFSLKYMRQQRSGFNPFLKDSCHTRDGYTMYGPMPDSTHLDVSGGWHDATDYLQYATTSANATYHLLAAYRDFPLAFTDTHLSNGLDGANGVADVLDEAKWGLDWLLKLHPRRDWLFHQLADDRDHQGFRLPTQDSVDYGIGKGNGRPVYFATGRPQGLGKYKNRSTGVASVAGKFASAFALAAQVYGQQDTALSHLFRSKALSAYQLGLDKPGVCQTAPNKESYFYEEDNWTDDMELGAAALYELTHLRKYLEEGVKDSREEKITPWMGADTARHYQWYPFHNFGHYELAKAGGAKEKAMMMGYYREGIRRVWEKAKNNAFYRGIPFIWCSNNLTVSFTIQCYLYRQLTGDQTYAELEQACFDWLYGCNPWGACMVYGSPHDGATPQNPHSSLAHLYNYPLDGGLVDGPVYGSIYKRLRGIKLFLDDKYAPFQSDFVVYHDDWGDYSTNEPTMDGTASLIYLLAAKQYEAAIAAARQAALLARAEAEKAARLAAAQAEKADADRLALSKKPQADDQGALVRGPVNAQKMALVFSADEFAEGGDTVRAILLKHHIQASFFLTGRFYANPQNHDLVDELHHDGHYLGAHSDQHLLYCDWTRRDSTLVTPDSFRLDLEACYGKMAAFGIQKGDARFFLPPYEWYNATISKWTTAQGLQLINYTPGTRSTADYTLPSMGNRYVPSDEIFQSIIDYESSHPDGLNGFILLMHIGTGPERTDKFFNRLDELVDKLQAKGYQLTRVDKLLEQRPGQ